MNLCIFGGNFVRDPELKNVGAEQVAVVNFTIAVNRKFTNKDKEKKNEPTYIDCEIWDSGAETIARNCKKGDFLIVYASAKNETWKDKTSGENRSKMKFRVDRFEFVPGTRKNPTNEDTEVTPDAPTSENAPAGDDIPF